MQMLKNFFHVKIFSETKVFFWVLYLLGAFAIVFVEWHDFHVQ